MKEQIIKQIEEVLVGFGFSRSEGDEWEYKRIQTFTQPGQQMVINGQVFQQPPQEIEVIHIVKDMGDGYYENMDGSNRVYTTYLEFQVWMKNEIQGQLSSAYAWDDIEGFKNDLQHILNV
jgi:hypothetical protein